MAAEIFFLGCQAPEKSSVVFLRVCESALPSQRLHGRIIYQIPIKIARDQMPRGRKLSSKQIERAAVDRRNGMSWSKLSKKYKCAINTMRSTLAEYSDEFAPNPARPRAKLDVRLTAAETEIDNIKRTLREQLNLPV